MKITRLLASTLATPLLISSLLWADRPVDLDITVVTGTRTEKRLSETPVRTEIISASEIEKTTARTLADAVEFCTGLRAENNCQNCNFSFIRILGLDGTYSQTLIDGQPLVSSLASVYGVEHIPARMIEQVEVVKGGGSSLYGPGSVAGVLNVITHAPTENGGSIDVRAESMSGEMTLTAGVVADLINEEKDFSFSVFGQVDSMDPYDHNGDDVTEIGKRDMHSLGFRAIKEWDGDRLVFDFNRTYEDRNGGSDPEAVNHTTKLSEAVQTTRTMFRMGWEAILNNSVDYSLTASHVLTERDSYYGGWADDNPANGIADPAELAAAAAMYGKSDNPLWVYDAQLNWLLGDHMMTFAVQHSEDDLTDSSAASRPVDVVYRNTGFSVQDDWFVHPNLSLIYGFRVDDHSELDDTVISPRFAARWSASDALTVRFSYATGFQAPRVFSEDLHIETAGDGATRVITNAADLKEEEATTYNLSLEYVHSLGKDYIMFESNAFFTDIKDKFAEELNDDITTNVLEYERINVEGAEVDGFEFNIGYVKPDSLLVELGVVSQNATYDEDVELYDGSDPAHPNVVTTRNIERTPELYGNFKVTLETDLGDFFLGLKYTGEMDVPHIEPADGSAPEVKKSDTFLTADVSWNKDLGGMRVGLGAKNITDEYQDDLDKTTDRDPAYVYGPRFPRTVYASLGYDF